MSLWIWAFIGGLAGTYAMDLGAGRFARAGINDALGDLLGRWVLGIRRGVFVIDGHVELQTPETDREAKVAKLFHYIVGGGGVALVYPAWFALTGLPAPENHILPGLTFGLLSVSLTWFLQYPCFGFGWFGRKGPEGSSTLLPPAILHTLYGLTMGVVVQVGFVVVR